MSRPNRRINAQTTLGSTHHSSLADIPNFKAAGIPSPEPGVDCQASEAAASRKDTHGYNHEHIVQGKEPRVKSSPGTCSNDDDAKDVQEYCYRQGNRAQWIWVPYIVFGRHRAGV